MIHLRFKGNTGKFQKPNFLPISPSYDRNKFPFVSLKEKGEKIAIFEKSFLGPINEFLNFFLQETREYALILLPNSKFRKISTEIDKKFCPEKSLISSLKLNSKCLKKLHKILKNPAFRRWLGPPLFMFSHMEDEGSHTYCSFWTWIWGGSVCRVFWTRATSLQFLWNDWKLFLRAEATNKQ